MAMVTAWRYHFNAWYFVAKYFIINILAQSIRELKYNTDDNIDIIFLS
jgi:hypothetical protein